MLKSCLLTSAASKQPQNLTLLPRKTHGFCIMHNSNRPDDALMVSHMEVLAMLLPVTEGEIRGKTHEGRITLTMTESKGVTGGADYLSERVSHSLPPE